MKIGQVKGKVNGIQHSEGTKQIFPFTMFFFFYFANKNIFMLDNGIRPLKKTRREN